MAIAGWEETPAATGSSVRLHILSVLYNTHYLYARPLFGLVIFAHSLRCGAEDLIGKLPIHHRYRWRVFVVMPGKTSARQQGRAGGIEVFGGNAV